MTSQEKARDLVNKFGTIEHSLICVEEIQQAIYPILSTQADLIYHEYEEVKQELNKL